MEPLIFNYNSRISWSIFIILLPVERGVNTPQSHVIFLPNQKSNQVYFRIIKMIDDVIIVKHRTALKFTSLQQRL